MSSTAIKRTLTTIKDGVLGFFSSVKPSKRIVGVGVVLGCLFFVVPNSTGAWFGIGEFASSAVANIIFTLSYVVSFVAGVFMALLAWMIEIILDISRDIPNSAVVKAGFPITLAIANLCLVLGLIVIAIMTILRNETYAAKKILSSLIIMAITINFGLVICSVLLNFSDSLSTYFLRAAQNPGAGQAGDTKVGIMNFSNALVGAFQPQRLFGGDQGVSGAVNTPSQTMRDIGSGVAGLLTPITSLFFVILVLIFIIIVLGTLFVMLLYRYVALAFLMVILPIAWVCWIFPAFNKYWNEWWNNFIKQAFFAPIVLFFLWLSIQVSYEMNKVGGGLNFSEIAKAGIAQRKESPISFVSGIFEGFFSGIAAQVLQAGVLLGLMIGGMIIADKMGIQFAKAATEAAKSSVKGMAGYAGRRTSGGAARAVTEERKPYVQSAPGAGLLARVKTAGANVGIAFGNGAKRVASATGAKALVNSEAARAHGVTQNIEQHGKKTDFSRASDGRKKAKELFAGQDRLNKEAEHWETVETDLRSQGPEHAAAAEEAKSRAVVFRAQAKTQETEGNEAVKKAAAAEKANPTLFGSVFVPPAKKMGEEFGLIAHHDTKLTKEQMHALGMHDDHPPTAPAADGAAPAAGPIH